MFTRFNYKSPIYYKSKAAQKLEPLYNFIHSLSPDSKIIFFDF